MSTATEKKNDTKARIKELQTQVDDLKELVNTLLSVIVEEPMVFTPALHQQADIHSPTPACDHPLMTAIGSRRRTGRARFARLVFSIT